MSNFRFGTEEMETLGSVCSLSESEMKWRELKCKTGCNTRPQLRIKHGTKIMTNLAMKNKFKEK